MHDPTLDLVAKLYALGRSTKEIAKRVNKPEGWVNQVIGDSEVADRLQDLAHEDVVDTGEELWSGDAKRFHQERLVPQCFLVWEQTLHDPEASYTAKLKATELIMKYDTTLLDPTKVDDEKVTHLQISDALVARLLRLQDEAREY